MGQSFWTRLHRWCEATTVSNLHVIISPFGGLSLVAYNARPVSRNRVSTSTPKVSHPYPKASTNPESFHPTSKSPPHPKVSTPPQSLLPKVLASSQSVSEIRPLETIFKKVSEGEKCYHLLKFEISSLFERDSQVCFTVTDNSQQVDFLTSL